MHGQIPSKAGSIMTLRFARLLVLVLLFYPARTQTIAAAQDSSSAAQAGPANAEKSGPTRNLTIDDYFRIAEVDDAQISPEGKWVSYTVTTHDLKNDKNKTRIWMISTSGGAAVPLTAEDVSSEHARWSPDGKYLAFLSGRGESKGEKGDEDKKKEVWVLNREGGEAQKLVETIQDVDAYAWSTSGDRIVLVLQDPSINEIEAARDKDKADAKPKAHPWVIDRLHFKEDEIGYLDRRRKHLFVYELASHKMTQVTSGDYDDSAPAWSPDGDSIAFVSNRSDSEDPDMNFNTDIWTVAADNADKGKSAVRVTKNPAPDEAPAWSPDGKWIVFIVGDDGTQNLARVPAMGGEITRPIGGRRMVESYTIGKDGSAAAVIGELTHPAEIYFLPADGGDLRRLTTTNDALMAQIRLPNVEYVHFKSKDGTTVAGYLYEPPDYKPGMRYPTILRPHGGPVWAYYAEFNFDPQLFAANGYVVLTPNPRGSSGYGQDFCKAIWADWGHKDYEDDMAMVDYAIAQGMADPDKLGVGGWSYGGISTNFIITQTTRFKAAISGAGSAFLAALYGHDQYILDYDVELGRPWENRAVWDKVSPYYRVANITTPTLFMGGDIDWNVPILGGEQMYEALKSLGRETELVVYPGEHHGLKAPSHIKDRLERNLSWYAHYVKADGSPPRPAAKTN